MVKVPKKSAERHLLALGYDRIIGLDEVGMACLAGPVVVCALAVPPDFYMRRYHRLAGIRDSKMLQAHRRETFAAELGTIPGLRWRIGSCDPETIDRINIYQASRLAMRNALAELGTEGRPMVLVDGNKLLKGIDVPQQAIVKGDRKIWAIAAASILAKVYRDTWMAQYAKEYPGYGFEMHKGYPTALHRRKLQELGLCPLHRRSFGLLKKFGNRV